MNVLYCGDRNIESGLIISILSLLKNAKTNLKVYVLTINSKEWNIDGVTDKCINVLDNKMKLINKENSIKKFDITEIFEKELPAKNMKTRFTPCCMLRLFADEIPELPDKILYLDNDVICRKDCQEFYNQDMEKYEIARVFRLLWKVVFQK
jgi:lipopolysaccharide biosynthesis glycosyltransferase